MNDHVEKFLKDFASCPELAKIYRYNHPEVSKAIQKTYDELALILNKQSEFVIGIVGNELTSGDDIFFDLSAQLSSFIDMMKGKGVEKITFSSGITLKEINDFILFFLKPENKILSMQEYLREKHVPHIQVDKIYSEDQDDDKDPEADEDIPFVEIYNDCMGQLSSSMMNVVENKSINFASFHLVTDNLMKGLASHYQEIIKLSKVKGKDTITFAHLLNVAMLGIHFSKTLGLNPDECRNIGMGGLFHDIGKLYISNSILKGDKISDQDFENIKSHTVLGAKILLSFVDNVGVLPAVIAMEHHLKFDGSGGYPKLKYSHPLHLGSMMISLCDVYDALSQRRSYKNAYPPEKIYEIMIGGRGSQFHPELFDAFFEFIGVWPNGTVVQLNNQKIAVVEKQNAHNMFAPVIKIISDGTNEVINLSKKTDIEIKKSLSSYDNGTSLQNPSEI